MRPIKGLLHAILVPFLFLTGAFLVTGAPHQGWDIKNYPNPTSSISTLRALCGSHVTSTDSSSFICDPDALLTNLGAKRVHEELDRIRAEVKGPCGTLGDRGYQVAVALAAKLQAPTDSYTDLDAVTASFAKGLHDSWGVGDAACHNGALLVVSKDDRTMYISRGEGLSPILTDDRLDSILERMGDKLRANDFDGAILGAVTAMGNYLQKGPPDWLEQHFGMIVLLLFAALFIGLVWWSHNSGERKKKEYEECLRKLQGIERERNRLRSNQLAPASSCPICLEDFNEGPTTGTGTNTSTTGTSVPGAEANGETETLMADEGARSGREKYGCDGNPVEYLPCGHIFCHSCLGEWLRNHDKCPICRAPIRPGGVAPPPAPPRGPCYDTATDTNGGEATLERRRSGRIAAQPQDITAELLFRLMMAQRRYPTLVSQPLVDRWANPDYQGSFTTDRTFTRQDPRTTAFSSSSSPTTWGSSSRSFGGGRSGGGRGGRW